MAIHKKELEVAALENGTVIDHIPSNQLFKVVSLLGLEHLNKSITIGNNLISKKEEEINKIALIAPNAKINIIRDYQVTEKRVVTLPDELTGIIRCNNPKCITNNEPMNTVFRVINKETVEVKCKYCERAISQKDIEIR